MQTLQLFRKIFKTEFTHKSNQNAKLEGLGGEIYQYNYKKGGSVSTLCENTLIKLENVS
jgi:hypothetical protein